MSRYNRVVGVLTSVVVVLAVSGAGHGEDNPPAKPQAARATAPVKTGKERLGDKASDDQRVDNCKVAPERRGPKVRPDACP
jgi:hypothetical protein